MSETQNTEIQESRRPRPQDVTYDLDQALSAVVSVRAEIPDDAFTAGILGTERAGNGVVIDEGGLVLTIGYLITEAESVWLMGADGQATQGHVVAYDQQTGLGLVQALEDLRLPPLPLGSAAAVDVGEPVVFAGFGGRPYATRASVIAKREFAGYWEYVLDEALFTAPAHPNWGGGALIDSHGRLAGIGSLFVQLPQAGKGAIEGNMVVPIDLLAPIRDELLRFGKTTTPPRPWLGIYVADAEEQFVIVGLAEDGPADKAGVEVGDRIIEVDGRPVDSLANLFRNVWAMGAAGVEVPLTLWRDGEVIMLGVRSIDRNLLLKRPRLH
jgi:S1-C subfamily serine protease